MKWLGQYIQDFKARFRSDVYLDSLTTTTDTSVLVVDSNNKICKSTTLADDIIESEIDTLAGLTSFGSAGATTNILAGDIDWYNPVNDGNPTLRWGVDANERFIMRPFYQSGTQTLQAVFFTTQTASSTANYGLYRFQVDSTSILDIDDGGIDLDANMGISINGTDILTDSSGTATLSNIDALDATTIATIESAMEGNLDTLGDILMTGLRFVADKSVTPGDGAMIHVDASTITDGNTSTSGTAAKYTHVNIESPTLAATNDTVTITDAATVYISSAPASSTENLTLTNAYALWVDAGDARFDGRVTVAGTIEVDSVSVSAIQTSGESFADNDTSIMTSAAIDDAILKGGSNTTIKVLPHHFMSNEDGGANKSAQFRDDTIIGVRATHNDAELYAFVEIPIGKTATSVTVYGNDTGNVVEVFESDINAGALTDKTHASGCVVGSACDITDVAADATNYLVIKVTITSYTNDIVYGAAVTIA